MIAIARDNRMLRRLLFGFAASTMGLQIGWIALVWWLLNAFGAGQLLGELFVAFQLPMLAVAPLMGALMDRGNAKHIAVGSGVAASLALCLLTFLAFSNHLSLPLLFGLIVIVSLATPGTLTYRRLLIGQITPENDLGAAYGLFSLASEAAILCGPAVGGLIVGRWSIGAALCAYAIGMAAYTWVIAGSRYIRDAEAKVDNLDVLRGTREIASRPLVLGVTLLSFFFFFAYGPLEVALPAAAQTVFHTNAAGYGTLWSAYAVGSVSGLIVLRSRYERLPAVHVLCFIAVTWGILAAALGFAPSIGVAMVILLVAGFFWSPYNALESALMQTAVPKAVQAAVFSMQSSFLYVLAVPLGAMLGGVALSRSTPQAVMIGSGLACVCAGILGFIVLRLGGVGGASLPQQPFDTSG